jgi:triosephosphate isomerase
LADVRGTVIAIRLTLTALFGAAAQVVPVLYGGSVNRENCAAYAALDLIDGLFVGRAARTATGFAEVFETAFAAKRAATVGGAGSLRPAPRPAEQ